MTSRDELLTRGVANIIPGKKELLGKLQNGKKLNVYFGIDPTSTKIHLGHAVSLRKLNEFAKQGHNVTFLIGDFTALIGDTSDKDSERPALTTKEIDENFKTYKKQAEKLLDFSKIKIKYNSEWLKKLNFEEILKLSQHFSVGDFVGRELVKKRLSENKRVGLNEFLYPVMQGYDSFMLNTDLQIGGTDQTFNMQAGRTLIKDINKNESFILTTPILEGTDGRKMSKSWGNAIWLDDNPNDVFAKVMAINDDLIVQYYTLATNVSLEEIELIKKDVNKRPLANKRELAFTITYELCGEKKAKDAEEYFDKTVRNKELPTNIQTFTPTASSGSTIASAVAEWIDISKSEAKRLIEQGGVTLNDKKITSPDTLVESGILRVGKKKITKIVIK
ncbi:MAG TPA: tyrosine--tRNA ligase [Candidatus Sulfotelmatobacter sp.]|nr:tyrosine--tRNA ligase [Candidatus Sulfotelmatobacter sp.]